MDSTSQRSSDERPSSELTSEERERLDGRAEQARQDDAVEESADIQLSRAFHRSLISGEERLHRSLPNMSATGVVGGMDVGIGVLALLVVKEATGSQMLASLAFASGFIILTLARSELFTENFMMPVTVVLTERRDGLALLRLWATTLVSNWLGGALLVGLVMTSIQGLDATAIEVGRHYPEMGIGWVSFAGGILGGVVITLMTWIQRANRDMLAQLAIAVVTAFLLAAPPLNHSVVGSLEMMGALFTGHAPFGWIDALGAVAWAVLGNVVGGVGLVTVLRLVQVGPDTIRSEQHHADRAHEIRQG
ncbi:MAG: formate/nitrite transporter family protein [Candidatus Microthrix subdominans]|jgi:formate/nitrite transporter FocA (FNT family)|uniref:Formate/nitrite transporter family protein n=1 Tax=Candidatus Neomicrothrix subdominans TaxID=2954438 RepID=A0A936NAY8_9ACTN|nr:formate/nitrite transporter family protein [Candidatus Microthrix sp.]MBK9296635.1 formate/nitrite transporter family protein [Candidatus Microthrix subdominans]MBK6310877.1 formate/nitrite transporter family protein [Candidatus Microthrix sp.]MBK6968750.1 formate/nitrite transporter family protein [Candidatus Microthrix sp.]MBK7166605.1 formate/nitrite transporter family protein [Candidatus Microthrix sp.]MBK9558483.1 formate/nitrite transporter family protein [Candidatus Microthrix sp.]